MLDLLLTSYLWMVCMYRACSHLFCNGSVLEVQQWMDVVGFGDYSGALLGCRLSGSMLQAASPSFCMNGMGMVTMGQGLHFCSLVDEALHSTGLDSPGLREIKELVVDQVLQWLQDMDLDDLLGHFRKCNINGLSLLQINV